MSDDQLVEYFDENSYFKNVLQNAIKSEYDIQSEKKMGLFPQIVKSIFKVVNNVYNPINALILPNPRRIIFFIVAIVVLATFATTTAVVFKQEITKLPDPKFSCNVTNDTAPLSVQFTNLSKNAIVREWNFGDGNNSTEPSPIHNYSAPGRYTVKLKVNNTYNTTCRYKDCIITVRAKPLLPVANFTTNVIRGPAPLTVKFTDLSENATKRNWDFGDNTSSKKQQDLVHAFLEALLSLTSKRSFDSRSPTHVYSEAGNYTVNLTVSNANGTNSKLAKVTVLETVLPVAKFTSSIFNGNATRSFQFNDTSTGTPTSWNWDFGDGSNSTEQNPIHTYLVAGNYTVSLTTINDKGTNSTIATINVTERDQNNTSSKDRHSASDHTSTNSNGKNSGDSTKTDEEKSNSGQQVLPVANFNSNFTSGSVPLSVMFTDTSTGSPISWNWNFGDGSNSIEQNPTHTYSAAGSYTVKLTASNANGNNSTSATIIVSQAAYMFIWNDPADIIYGTPLSSTQLNASALYNGNNIPGTFNYSLEDGTKMVPGETVLGAGKKTLHVDFTPTDVVNYRNASKDVTINVIQANSAINWSKPANITYGTALNSTQLNARANVEGTFNYTPASGTVLNAGVQTLHVNFTPTDTANYTGASKKVSINVLRFYAYITNFGNNTVSIIDTAENKVINTITVGSYPLGVAISPDGSKVYVTNWGSNDLSVIDTANNKVTDTVNVSDRPSEVAVTPDGKKAYVTNFESVSVIDTVNNTVDPDYFKGIQPFDVAVSPYGIYAFVTNPDGNNVYKIDTDTNSVYKVNVGNSPHGLTVSPDGRNVYVTNWDSNDLSVIDIATNTVTDTVKVGEQPFGVAVSPDGTKVYVTNNDSTVSVIDSAAKKVTTYVHVKSPAVGIAVSQDGKYVYVANYGSDNAPGNTVSVIDTVNNSVIATINVESRPWGVAISPTGKIA